VVAKHGKKHTISKNEFKHTCRFCSTTNLSYKYFNFSCKIYQTKVYTTFTKVVVLFTRKLTKLFSHFAYFLLNFYTFYKLASGDVGPGQANKWH
jgi:hypothetical protein